MRRSLLTGLCAALAMTSAWAENARVREVDAVYQDQKRQWEQKQLASGLADAAKFTDLESAPTPRNSGTARTTMQLHNVDFRITGEIGFEIRDLVATLEPLQQAAPVNLDRVESFIIHLHRGEVLVRARSLTALFNRYILDYENRSLNAIQVKTGENRMTVAAGLRLNQLYSVELPSTLEGGLRITSDNRLSFDIDGISVAGIPVADVLKTVGISLPSLVRLERKGASLSKFGLTLDHRTVFPPPYFKGNVSVARLSREGLHLTFMDAPGASLPPLAHPQTANMPMSFMRIQSGDPKFFGVIVLNAQVVIVPEGDKPLVFDLYDYRRRLAKGMGHIAEDGSVTLRVPN